MFWETLSDCLLDALIDTAKIFPVLFLAYLVMEFLEHKMSDKTDRAIKKAGAAGPFIGALFGVIPQCGFAGAASSFYAGRVITLGTLIAVFLSSSDEMLPILIAAENVQWSLILKILAYKVVCGMLCGFLTDLAIRCINKLSEPVNIHEMCEREHCSCKNGMLLSALKHSVKVIALIFVITVILNLAFEYLGAERISGSIWNMPVIGEIISALIGLIPNCASSVIITNLFLKGAIGAGPMLSGLLVNSGIGILVLFRMNRGIKRNLMILGLVFVFGIVFGLIGGLIF